MKRRTAQQWNRFPRYKKYIVVNYNEESGLPQSYYNERITEKEFQKNLCYSDVHIPSEKRGWKQPKT